MDRPTMIGNQYTFIAPCETSKFVVAWHLGKRDHINTEDFISKVRTATAAKPLDVSTDAFQPYESAIDARLYDHTSHSSVVKLFSHHVEEDIVSGNPDLDRASTSHIERKNGSLRQRARG